MRLARTIWDQSKAEKTAQWLRQQGLEIELQPHPQETPTSWRIWILDEDALDRAREWVDLIEKGELNIDDSLSSEKEVSSIEIAYDLGAEEKKAQSKPRLTQALISLMVLIHILVHVYLPIDKAKWVLKKLMVDDPQSVATHDIWPGLYTILLKKIQHLPIAWNWSDFLFDIRSGEFWRIFSPALLHGDWIHLIFNMLWFNILGSVTELRIGRLKMIALIAISAAISNLLQYLVSGFAFLGFSGVVMALVGFTYARYKHFPWEAYPITPSTFSFIGFYLILTLSLQLVSFILEAFSLSQAGLGIANTAHLTGLAIGWILGRSRVMSLKP